MYRTLSELRDSINQMTTEEKDNVKWILMDQLTILHECNLEELQKNPECLEYYNELFCKVRDILF